MILQYAVRLAALHALTMVAKELAGLIMDTPAPQAAAPVQPTQQPPPPGTQSRTQRPGEQRQFQEYGHNQQPYGQSQPYGQQQRQQFAQQPSQTFGQREPHNEYGYQHHESHRPLFQNMRTSHNPNSGSFSDPTSPSRSHQYNL